MNDQNESVQSAKGWSTLIGDLSVLQLDRVIEELKRLRSEGSAEEEIAEHLKTHYRLIDADTKKRFTGFLLGSPRKTT